MTIEHAIRIADRLLEDGHITRAERKQLIVKDGKVWDDSRFVAEITEAGDVVIHRRGAYPLVLEGCVRTEGERTPHFKSLQFQNCCDALEVARNHLSKVQRSGISFGQSWRPAFGLTKRSMSHSPTRTERVSG
jgi:hypothetical protein